MKLEIMMNKMKKIRNHEKFSSEKIEYCLPSDGTRKYSMIRRHGATSGDRGASNEMSLSNGCSLTATLLRWIGKRRHTFDEPASARSLDEGSATPQEIQSPRKKK